MAPRMLRRRRRALMRRYKTPKSTDYLRCTIDIINGLSKITNNVNYEWAGSNSPVLNLNNQLKANANFTQFCKQFSYVRIKALTYLANPDAKNQSTTESGFVGLSVWPRGYLNEYGTWEKCADNPFFKVLNYTEKTYKYCNLLGGDNEWRTTDSGEFTSCSIYAVSSFSLGSSTAACPDWLVKISVDCVFKSPVQ